MIISDTEILAQVWVDDDVPDAVDNGLGNLERCVIEIERTDLDELRIGVRRDDDNATHVYIARDRALRLGHALIERALAEWGGVR